MNIIKRIRKSHFTKGLAAFLILNILGEIIAPTVSMALTSGPSQPEVQSFEPVETTDMVNLFTGDFTYNIPLMYLPGPNGGYPINLAYHGGVTMDQEASWVGLGWNVNPGALVRNVRGFADDYDGDEMITKVSMKDNITVGLGVGANIELYGGEPPISFLDGSTNSTGSIGASLGIRYNNYKGFGVNLGANYSPPFADDKNMKISGGLTLDSEAGLGANANVSYKHKAEGAKRASVYGLGLSYGSEGMGLAFSRSKSLEKKGANFFKTNRKGDKKVVRHSAASGTATIGFSANSHMPSISYPMSTNHLNISFKTGPGSFLGLYGNMTFSGSFNTQKVQSAFKNKDVEKKVYGYENLENSQAEDVMDFTREKESIISKNTPNLATPMLTYDVYNAVGQGMSGMFRPFRTDIGRVHDPLVKSKIFGGSIALDLGLKKIGFGGQGTVGNSKQRAWDDQNDWSNFTFQKRDLKGSDYKYRDNERVYYRMHGDKSIYELDEMSFIGGEEVVQPTYTTDTLKINTTIKPPAGIYNVRNNQNSRIPRNTLIHKLKNEDINSVFDGTNLANITEANIGTSANIGEYSIFYYDWSTNDNEVNLSSTTFLNRTTRNSTSIGHHNGGYKILNQDGQYYVYGLPAYNNVETESAFTVTGDGSVDPIKNLQVLDGEVDFKISGTDKFIDKKTKPPYAHSYMLTSILGADYVDIDNNGPSDEDLGYWVKFNYVKYSNDYKWRAPYYGCNYDRGSNANIDDDKGTYVYGEKELWYVASMETKTHIMVYEMSERDDMVEASGEYSDSLVNSQGTQSGLKIDRILLYTKANYNSANPVAIQIVNFEYDYSLCQKVFNNKNGEGKLTLKKVWFEYEGSTRGATNPYIFEYDNTVNYEYDPFQYDRWGSHKEDFDSIAENNFANRFLPYVKQFDQNDATNPIQDEKDDNAAAWSLSKINLPSGGEINVTYEADDYAYVQNEVATQMFNITQVNPQASGNDVLYKSNGNANEFQDPRSRRIYFKLEKPLAPNLGNATYAQIIYDNYVKDLVVDEKGDRNLYFKTYSDLRDSIFNYSAGYIPIIPWDGYQVDYNDTLYERFGIDASNTNSNGDYTQGFITIDRQFKKIQYNDSMEFDPTYYKKYHPFAMAAWQNMRLTDPLLLTAPAGIDLSASADGSAQNKADAAASLLGMVPSTIQMFTGIWKYCRNNHFARKIDLTKSVIRLTTPDKQKYGGGHRIKQIAITDNWDSFSNEASATYGVEYDYSTVDENSLEKISSGVAQYEPMQGGDEIALRTPKFYVNNVPFKSNNSTFFEHPINEFYYPAPVVGYSKVTVRSLNTGLRIKNAQDPNVSQNNGIGTTGVTEYEFYTAKDFPVIVEETKIEIAKRNITIPIPFIGKYVRKKIKAIQGYKIELNDMHGQMKSVKKFGVNPDYTINDTETSSVRYVYQFETEIINGKQINRLDNRVKAIDPTNGIPTAGEKLIGIEYEYFTDQRQNKSTITTVGVENNIDIIVIPFLPSPIPIPAFFPKTTTFKQDMKTFVSNKIIFKSGIVKHVYTNDGKSSVKTTNDVYDGQTGRPLIVSVNNEYYDKIYNYSHPAHWEYDQMGGAYKNIDLVFKASIVAQGGIDGNAQGELFKFECDNIVKEQLVQGDELIARWLTVDIGDTGYPYNPSGDSYTDIFITNLKIGDNIENYIGVDPIITAVLAPYTTYFGGVKATYLGAQEGEADFGFIHVDSRSVAVVEGLVGSTQKINFRVIRSGRRNHVFADAGTVVSKQMPVHYPGTSLTVTTNENIVSEQIGTNSTNSVGGTFDINKIDRVINASAVLYKDKWSTEYTSENPFLIGEAGIWRPYKSYVYAGVRNSANLANPDSPDIRNSGEMDNVEMFNWQVTNFENYAPNWEWASEITRYNSEAYEIENEDRLGIKSAAIYGLKGSLVLGVGANGGHSEIGTENFETHSVVTTNYSNEEGNLNFFNLYESGGQNLAINKIVRDFKIVKGKSLAAGEFILEIAVDRPFNFINNTKVKVAIQTSAFASSEETHSYVIPCTLVSTEAITSTDFVTVKVKTRLNVGVDELTFIHENQLLEGRISFDVGHVVPAMTYPISESNVQFDNHRAHTGKKSMKLMVANSYLFPQDKLDLIEGKTYVLSAWVSEENSNQISFENYIQFYPKYASSGTWVNENNLQVSVGKVVEGWQKIEVEFTHTASDAMFGIFISTASISPVYVDDIRISPKTGGIVTYVYDVNNFRLQAMLDNNNYATFYYYDEQGNLHLVKKETEKGIQTISESRGFNKNTN